MANPVLLQCIGAQFSKDQSDETIETKQKGTGCNDGINLNEAPCIAAHDTNQLLKFNSILHRVFNVIQEQLDPDINHAFAPGVVDGELFHINCSPDSSAKTQTAQFYYDVRTSS